MPNDPQTATPTGSSLPAHLPALGVYLLVPVLIGFVLGASRTGLAANLPWAYGVAFWIACSLGTWVCFFAGTSLAATLLKPWNPPLWLLLTIGAVIGSLPARYIIYGAAAAMRDHLTGGRTPRPLPPMEWSFDFLVYYVQGWAGSYVAWIVVGLIFARWLGVPKYSRDALRSAESVGALPVPEGAATGQGAAVAAAPSAGGSSPLLDRLPQKLGRNVLALEAEDHYVRVHTDQGSALVLARLSDAIAELGPVDGIRVHRSYWVRRDAVRKVSTHGKGLLLKLSNGIDVPVSQAYKQLALQAGLSAD